MSEMRTREVAVANLMMREALRFGWRRRLHFSVLAASRDAPPNLRYEWCRGRMFGVSFDLSDTATAEAWLIEAMREGYCPIINWRKRGDGYQPRAVSEVLAVSPWYDGGPVKIPKPAALYPPQLACGDFPVCGKSLET